MDHYFSTYVMMHGVIRPLLFNGCDSDVVVKGIPLAWTRCGIDLNQRITANSDHYDIIMGCFFLRWLILVRYKYTQNQQSFAVMVKVMVKGETNIFNWLYPIN